MCTNVTIPDGCSISTESGSPTFKGALAVIDVNEVAVGCLFRVSVIPLRAVACVDAIAEWAAETLE